MKKIIFLLPVLLSFYCYGQINKLNVGVIGGPSISFLYADDEFGKPKSTVAARGSAGIFAQYDFNKYLSLSGDILYTQTGENVKINLPFYAYTFPIVPLHINYLNIPILLKAGYGNKVHFYGIAGPYVSIFINGKEHLSDQFSLYSIPSGNISIEFKKVDLGISVGAGFSVPFAKSFSFMCEIRNNVGLYNISLNEPNNGITYYNQTIKNFSSSLMLGVSYKFSKLGNKAKM